MDTNSDLLNEAADLIAGQFLTTPDATNCDRIWDLIKRLRQAAKPRVLQDYLIQINYRTNAGNAASRRVRLTAASYSEAYDKAKNKVRRSRGVSQIDGGHAIGQPLPIA